MMSLLVNNFIRLADESIALVDVSDHSEELAGFENYRHSVFNSAAALELGLVMLPKLAFGDIYAEGRDIGIIRSEALVILKNIDIFATQIGVASGHLRLRMDNIVRACDRADSPNCGVVIW